MRWKSLQNCFIRPMDAVCHAFVTQAKALRDRPLCCITLVQFTRLDESQCADARFL